MDVLYERIYYFSGFMDYNAIEIIGNLCADVELKSKQEGQPYVMFSVATNYRFKRKNSEEYEQETTFHNCIANGKLAESIAKMGVKGKRVFVRGRVRTNETEKNGMKITYTSVIVGEFIMLSKVERAVMTADEVEAFIIEEELPAKNPVVKRELQNEEITIEQVPF